MLCEHGNIAPCVECDIGPLKAENEALRATIAGLVKALEEIIDPIRFMEERLEEGERLDGMAAVQLAKDVSYLRGIAIAAHRKQETSHEQ